MSESPASLRREIGSAADLQSVVRAMKAQAAGSVGQYERSVAALGDYARTVELGLGVCLRGRGLGPQAAPAGPVSRRLLVFGSDQGLVGRFNDIVLDLAQARITETNVQVWAVGDRVRDSLVDRGIALAGSFPVPGSVQAIAGLVGRILIEVALSGDPHAAPAPATELRLFFNRPTPPAGFAPQTERLLPLDDAWLRRMAAVAWPTATRPEVIDRRAADSTPTLRALIREYLFISLFRACAESLASENASRLDAMDRADRNIDRMMTGLQGRFQRLRQGGIDAELSDLISGFRALQPMP